MGNTSFEVPFIIYVDFKVMLQSSEEETDPDPLNSYTRDINHHVPSRFCTYTTFAYEEAKDLLRLYQGKDCAKVFCNHIKEEAETLTYVS